MPRSPSLRKSLKWIGIALSLLLLFTYITSNWAEISYNDGEGRTFALQKGGLRCLYFLLGSVGPGSWDISSANGDWNWWFRSEADASYAGFWIVPVWPLCLLSLAATTLAWIRDHQQSQLGSEPHAAVSPVVRHERDRVMRYGSRRRLLIVLLLASIFVAALPYLFAFIPEPDFARRLSQKPGIVHENRYTGIFTQTSSLSWDLTPQTAEIWPALKAEWGDLVPDEVLELTNHQYRHWITIQQAGLPFRVTHSCLVHDGYSGEWFPTSTTGNYFPRGIKWPALLANVTSAALFAGSAYIALARLRARRRINCGQCWNCAYQSINATCPECGIRP